MDAEFDKLVLETIHNMLRSTFGSTTTEIIYRYLKTKCCLKSEIPLKLNVFCWELRNILEIQGSNHVGIHNDITVLGTTAILEKAMTKKLCEKLGIEFNEVGPIDFPDYIKKIKVHYHNKNKNNRHDI